MAWKCYLFEIKYPTFIFAILGFQEKMRALHVLTSSTDTARVKWAPSEHAWQPMISMKTSALIPRKFLTSAQLKLSKLSTKTLTSPSEEIVVAAFLSQLNFFRGLIWNWVLYVQRHFALAGPSILGYGHPGYEINNRWTVVGCTSTSAFTNHQCCYQLQEPKLT